MPVYVTPGGLLLVGVNLLSDHFYLVVIATDSNVFLPASVAAAANPAAVYGSAPGGAALIMYGFGTKAAGAKPAENTPVTVTKGSISPKQALYTQSPFQQGHTAQVLKLTLEIFITYSDIEKERYFEKNKI